LIYPTSTAKTQIYQKKVTAKIKNQLIKNPFERKISSTFSKSAQKRQFLKQKSNGHS
jgi:hypothetical protein